MISDNIKVGDRLEISQKNDDQNAKSYVSQVEHVLDKKQLVIHMPISYGQLIKLKMNQMYSMIFFTEKGIVKFDTAIIKFTQENNLNFILIKLVSEGVKIQRREFFRFTCLLPAKFALFNNNDENADDKGSEQVFNGIIKDLGGGGIRFVTNQDLEEKSKIKCVIVLDNDVFVVLGKILYKQYFPKSNYKYQYRVEFVGMINTEQEKIVQYIFDQQRKIIRTVKP